jgi:NAD(P)-dependent dehydrogenase (short-subunit alcohol dehydrogenase family)
VAKSALIFGGTGGIGSALAAVLKADGWEVAVAARGDQRLASLTAKLGVLTIPADATKPEEVDRAFAAASGEFGGLGAAVNCVGSILIKPAHLTSDAEWLETLNLNLSSAFYVLRTAVKQMRKDGGAVALCSSAAAQVGLANHEAIAAAKGGIISLVKSAAATYASSKVRVNAVAPGLVDTPMATRIVQNPNALKVSLAMHAMGRIGTPEDVASALKWLIEPSNSWVTGQVIGVEGGLCLK